MCNFRNLCSTYEINDMSNSSIRIKFVPHFKTTEPKKNYLLKVCTSILSLFVIVGK